MCCVTSIKGGLTSQWSKKYWTVLRISCKSASIEYNAHFWVCSCHAYILVNTDIAVISTNTNNKIVHEGIALVIVTRFSYSHCLREHVIISINSHNFRISWGFLVLTFILVKAALFIKHNCHGVLYKNSPLSGSAEHNNHLV